MAKQYRKRIYDRILRNRLEARGAILIEGPKWCGKTTTAQQIAGSALYMAKPSDREQNLQLADIQPEKLLEGPVPRLIDEWQVAPSLWDAVRFEVDERDEFGQFILTGSAVPPNPDRIEHTGTGRIGRLRMRPFSLLESEDSSGAVSLEALFNGADAPIAPAGASIDEIAFLIARGGWPKALGCSERVALRQAVDYLTDVVNSDISRVDNVRRNPQLARRLVRELARMESSQAKTSRIIADLQGPEGREPSDKTVRSYITALERIFVIENLPAWNPNLRSKAAVRAAATWHFVDPSLAAAALGAGPGALVRDLKTMGLLFEGLCIRDLRAYADALEADVFHYRDASNLECDAVLVLRDGRYGLIEIKLGGDRLINEGARNLKALAEKIDTSTMPEPSFLMVLTGTGPRSYTRQDGVVVVPVTTLGV